ncbi:site-specific DNA-methyltransferase [Dehalococcoidia bacterium]|nr:site-specific DNA-methyltransferase [Dehalococcoidia bacterium]
MTKIEITRTELVWPGKYDEDGQRKEVERVNLPFQVIETINETRATPEAAKKPRQASLFDIWEAKEGDTFEEGWRNKLIWGDNKYVMSSLLDKFAGKIDLIYIDPPFATGADFNFTTQIGEADLEVSKEQSIIEEKAYRDTWGKYGPGRQLDSYLEMIHERLVLMRDLLTETGSIYVHLDSHVGHYVKPIMDEILGKDNFQRQIIWDIRVLSGFKTRAENWIRGHDIVFFYTKTDRFTFNKQTTPHRQEYIDRFNKIDEEGRRYFDGRGGRRYLDEVLEKGKAIGDVWDDIMSFQQIPTSKERLPGYPTQKPEALSERIIKASSNEGDLVADFFCGSGTTMAVAERLGRRWIGCDLSRYAIHITRKRLLGIENCRPFEVLNLGKYERKYWQGITFGGKKQDQQLAIFEYLAFILRLYGAQPLTGMEHLHGMKGNAVVHVGAVDAPVTIDEINACLDECLAIKQKELHILGWEWEMGLYDIITDAARGRGIKLVLRTIPREVMEQQAVDKGDISFFELAYLEADIQQQNRQVVVILKDFVIPNTELIPDEVRNKVKKWSDYIDYWAVDWDFQNDTFMNGWVTYRTRKERTLALKSDPHTYEKPGKYTVMVKVVDIFGIDTSQAFEVEVR